MKHLLPHPVPRLTGGLALAVIAGLLAGCTSYKMLKLTQPPERATVSVQPTLTWEPYKDPDVTYDVKIWEKGGKSELPGSHKEVYSAENIKGTSHTVAMPLEPGRNYMWSVRVRKGDDVSSWAMVEKSMVLLLYNTHSVTTPSFCTKSK